MITETRHRAAGWLVPLLLVALGPIVALGELTLPLGGYFRAGDFVAVDTGDAAVEITGDGVVPTRAPPGVVAPVLVLSNSTSVLKASSGETIAIHPLRDHQRLVGVVDGADPAAGRALFPGDEVIVVTLNRSRPLLSNPIVYSPLDAVILNSAPTQAEVSALLSAGCSIAISSSGAPDQIWPWKQQGNWWLLQHRLLGPRGALAAESVYQPADAYQPQQPAPLRRQVVLGGVLVSLLMLATLLVRGRWGIVLVILVGGASIGGAELWRRRMPTTQSVGGEIVVSTGEFRQNDYWIYRIATQDSRAPLRSIGAVWPMLLGADHAARIGLRLEYDGTTMRWEYALRRGAKLATRVRIVNPGVAEPRMGPPAQRSPLDALARSAYLRIGWRVAAHASRPPLPGDLDWPTVLIEPTP